jgi:hypothetical protein
MTYREMNLRVFQRKPIPQILFQPRIEPWFDLHRRKGDLPKDLIGLDVAGAYDALGLSMRYVHYFTGQPDPVERTFAKEVRVHSKTTERGGAQIIDTPHGQLVTGYLEAGEAGCRIVDFPVKQPGDLKKLEWLFRNTRYSFNRSYFDQGSAFIGDRGQPQFWVPRSPYQSLSLEWMKFEDFVLALMDAPLEIEQVMKAIDDSYDDLFLQIVREGGPTIINFGENIDSNLLSPRFFERYHIPYYLKRSTPLRESGIFTTVHLDGSIKSLLPYLKDLPFDGLEALTPAPMGDATLEEMKNRMGDKVLLDGIPAIFFIPPFTLEDVQRCVERIIQLFAPRLVLGISDEFPMAAGEEGIDRLKWVVDYCKQHEG